MSTIATLTIYHGLKLKTTMPNSVIQIFSRGVPVNKRLESKAGHNDLGPLHQRGQIQTEEVCF